jgi:hypothetical protein
MTGRIKLLRGGTPISQEDTPKIDYDYDQPGEFDTACGTFGLASFQLPQDFCPDRFVCNTEGATDALRHFSSCVDAMNCAMFSGMTTNVASSSDKALFMHQMIPHHQNAVNMAKALLTTGALDCDDTREESENCLLKAMMYDIVNNQNFQIQTMTRILEKNDDFSFADNCDFLGPSPLTQRSSEVDSLQQSVPQEAPCTSSNNIFTVKPNLFSGQLGYFTFEECGDQVHPTLGLEIGETYTFVQKDVSNFFHPMGFAYFPDGAHNDGDELEPGVTQTAGNDCVAFLNCSAPMYFLDGKYLGTYNNIPEQGNLTTGKDNFGLDNYEPLFFHPLPEWAGYGEFSIKLRFTDEDHQVDIFYFCHVSTIDELLGVTTLQHY